MNYSPLLIVLLLRLLLHFGHICIDRPRFHVLSTLELLWSQLQAFLLLLLLLLLLLVLVFSHANTNGIRSCSSAYFPTLGCLVGCSLRFGEKINDGQNNKNQQQQKNRPLIVLNPNNFYCFWSSARTVDQRPRTIGRRCVPGDCWPIKWIKWSGDSVGISSNSKRSTSAPGIYQPARWSNFIEQGYAFELSSIDRN